ncbi:hypothetical protein ACTHPH_12120 [Paenibacillus pasadenensis]|uniref:hypothetical protein n=1 Tax=Paenibacillus pasadenensis TaxID=217090 RepID=UPI000417CF6D|nr:hypothetical protein [Paenibacillus pasadenensis]
MKQILVFVLFAAMFCWMMFSPVYKHVLVMREAMLQKEVDYLLEIGASGSRGYIDAEMLEQARGRLAAVGMRPEAVEFRVSSTNGLPADRASEPLPRGTGLRLEASYPYERLFEIDRLIGIPAPSAGERIRAVGLKMSEFVP